MEESMSELDLVGAGVWVAPALGGKFLVMAGWEDEDGQGYERGRSVLCGTYCTMQAAREVAAILRARVLDFERSVLVA